MNTPLDSFEFGDNLVAVFASPLISKRATNAKDIGVSRYDLYKQGNKNLQLKYKETYEKMDNLYKNEMSNYAMKVLETVQQNSNIKLFEGDKVTELGQYTLPLILPEIAKYAVVESLAPKVKVNVDDTSGEIAYDYNSLKNVHLQSLGITNPSSPEDEADMVISKMRKGISKLSVTPDSPIVKSIEKSLNGTSANSFKLADLIIDKTQSGLDWRIDATKDIADIEALRNGNNNFDYTWQSVINFWKDFNQGVLSKNPNAYTVAEITDEGDLHRIGLGHWSDKFHSQNDIIQKFQRETGIQTLRWMPLDAWKRRPVRPRRRRLPSPCYLAFVPYPLRCIAITACCDRHVAVATRPAYPVIEAIARQVCKRRAIKHAFLLL